ncbi:4-amino-4-deoxy-L-arabinose transferase-like glycosyltransferase [Lewinella aquimaris]|uniref:4-amino-4-deoxy-L-arabinose transferase-like glycosyltransferase n=1 Tax=Neolewinella aquimaris TaxID=1835722 RepID=A0A840EDH6_9BACT|nr:glycosyltransferase family 39 protein [Neolewinella aquimaris]MBB4079859.1 4-amino-4-deoxy-L-arabinose transferase-like glycosyltransferase [Neolewinella aquimaris]
MNSGKEIFLAIGALLLICVLWSWGLGQLWLFDWDEINFAEIAREMHLTGNLLQPTINYLPFHEKPPLFAWMQWLSYRALGVNEFAARFPNILCGAATLSFLAYYGRRRGIGYWWAAFYAGSLLPALYFRSGIIDPWFNLFILLAVVRLFSPGPVSLPTILLSGLLLGLAILTKGPVAALIVGLVALGLLLRRRGKSWYAYLLVGLLSLLPAALWLTALWQEDGGYFVRAFFEYQWRLFTKEDAGHGGFFGYHVVVLLIGCFPAALFALPALVDSRKYGSPTDRGMRMLFWVTLILFSIVSTKIVHYSSLCYFPLTWFAARWTAAAGPHTLFPQRLLVGLRSVWGLYLFAALLIAVAGWTMAYWLPLVTDSELASRLEMPVSWPWYTILPTLIVASLLLVDAYLKPPRRSRAALHLLAMFLFCLVALPVFAPRIQQYTQGAAVEFYRSFAGQDVLLGTCRYKSYTPLFYGAVTQEQGGRTREQTFYDAIPHPLYFSSPLRLTEKARGDVPDAELLYQRGGFSFFRRPVPPPAVNGPAN